MNTIVSIAELVVKRQPFLTKMLADELVNLSSLARKLKPQIDEELKKDVKIGSIVMALKRLTPILQGQTMIQTNRFCDIYVNLTVRSNLSVHTFEKSNSIVYAKRELFERLSGEKNVFHTVSCGVYETSIVISEQYCDILQEIFKNEILRIQLNNLSSITINLDSAYADFPGLYYTIFSKLAWLGISVKEIISTSYEISLIIDDKDTALTYDSIKELFSKRKKIA